MGNMTDQEIPELAAILINEHGHAAIEVACRRRDQHADDPQGETYRLWDRILAATARLLHLRHRLDETV